MRVALYARVSSEEQVRHGLSIEAQLAALDEWAKDKTVVDRYVDLGISARKPASKRPELQRLLRDVEAGKIDLIAFVKLDRWFRNVKEYYKVDEVLEKHHVAWTAINEDYETQTASGRFKVNIMLAVAQDEADRTGERIKAVFDMKQENGEVLNQKVPLGISIVDKHRVANDEAEKATRIFEHYIATRSMRQVVAASEQIAGRHLSYSSVRAMLTNHAYVETGIIDQQMFNTVAALRRERAPRINKSGRVYLFSGLLFCADCGRRLAANCVAGINYYKCTNAAIDGVCLNTRHVREDVVEQYLLDNTLAEVKRLARAVPKNRPVDTTAIKRKMDKLTDLYLNDLISRDKYEVEYRDCQARLNAAERIVGPPNVKEYTTVMDIYSTLSRAAKRAFWGAAIETVTCKDGTPFDFTLRLPAKWQPLIK